METLIHEAAVVPGTSYAPCLPYPATLLRVAWVREEHFDKMQVWLRDQCGAERDGLRCQKPVAHDGRHYVPRWPLEWED